MVDKLNKQTTNNWFESITLAVSTQWHTFPHRFDWLAENGFAMAYTPDAKNLNLTRTHVDPYLRGGTLIRYHGYFPGFEIGHRDAQLAEEALDLHMKSVDAMVGLGEQVMTVHIGLVPSIELSHQNVVKNLTRLVEYAKTKGIIISLENLRFGATSNPEILLDWVEKSGASITLDVGHAVSSARVCSGELSVVRIIDLFSAYLEEVHFYEYETDTHYAPKNMSILGPIVDSLSETRCKWWTIELESYDDILHTRNLINTYLAKRTTTVAV